VCEYVIGGREAEKGRSGDGRMEGGGRKISSN
jgi:hypothetical protein